MKTYILLFILSIAQIAIGQVCKNTHFENYAPGTYMTNQCEDVIISAINFNGPDIAMIFDSDSPNPSGDDPDLQVFLGHILIISEDGDASDPDDAAGGGILIFDFTSPKSLDTLTLIDMELPGSSVRVYDIFGSMLLDIDVPLGDDCGCVRVDLYQDNVSRMEVEFSGSGAIDDFDYTEEPLSINLHAFHGRNLDGIHHLKWKVSEEVNFSHFELMHSMDAFHWSKIGTLPGGKKEYSYEHLPINGMHYYQLIMVDKNGTRNQSPIVSLVSNGDPLDNPMILDLVKVYDVTGRLLQRGDQHAGILLIHYQGRLYKRAFLRNW